MGGEHGTFSGVLLAHGVRGPGTAKVYRTVPTNTHAQGALLGKGSREMGRPLRETGVNKGFTIDRLAHLRLSTKVLG